MTDKPADQPQTNTIIQETDEEKEAREKAGEKFNKAVSEMKAAGDPSDFVQERIRTTPDHRSDAAADDDAYPEDKNDDASQPGYEPGTEPQKADREKDKGTAQHQRATHERDVKEGKTAETKPSGQPKA